MTEHGVNPSSSWSETVWVTASEPVDPDRECIGESLVVRHVITPEELDAARASQLRTGRGIGEILVEEGKITRLELASVLSEHWEARTYDCHGLPQSSAEDGTPGTGESPFETVVGRFEAVVAELVARASDADATEARLTAIEAAIVRLDELEARVGGDPGERVETRIDELYKLRAIDSHAAHAASEQLGERVDDLTTLRTEDAQAARAAHAEAKRAAAEAARVELDLQDKLDRLATEVAALRGQLETQTAIEERRAREVDQAWRKDPAPRKSRKRSKSGKKHKD